MENKFTIDLNHITNEIIFLEGISYIILDHLVYNREINKRNSRHLAYMCHKMSMGSISINGKQQPEELVSLYIPQHDDKKCAFEHSNIVVGKNGKLEFQILFNATALLYISNEDSITISFNIIFQPTKEEEGITTPCELTVIKQKAKPTFFFTLNDEWQNGKMFELSQMDLGNLTISNSTDYHFAHSLTLSDVELVLIDEKKKIYKNLIHPKINNNHANKQYLDEGIEGKKYYLKNLPPQVASSTLWYINLNTDVLKHPHGSQKFTLCLIGKRKLDNTNHNDDMINLCSLAIMENTITPELVFELDSKEIIDEDRIRLEDKKYNLNTNNDYIEVAVGKIRNRATADNPSQEIKKLQIEKIGFNVYIEDATTDPFKQEIKQPVEKNINDIIRLKIKTLHKRDWIAVQELKEAIPLPNHPDSIVDYLITYDEADFSCLPRDKKNSMCIHAVIDINYSKIGGRGISKSENKKCHFTFNLQQFEGKNWLAVDLGTSAIVAKYGDKIIDLQKAIEKKQKENGREYSEKEIEEFGTRFLSSTLLLKNDMLHELCMIDGHINELASTVELSPDIRTINENIMFLAPFVKSLIGFKELPVDLLNKNLLYFTKGAEKLSVAHIIKATYLHFFKNYLEPQLKAQGCKEKNKMAVTVPNVFTNRQKDIIKDVIIETFPTIWEDAIYFISESDAIAWYYYTNRGKLGGNKEKSETILVYDMGAGTLDLTLFKCDPSNKKEPIILSKVGLTTAGNYLDTILADAVFKQLTDPSNSIIEIENKNFHPVNNFKTFEDDAIAYKKFIRNILKPALSDPELAEKLKDETFKFKLADKSFTLNDINLKKIKESDEKYLEYLKKVTEEIIVLLKKNTIEEYSDFRIDKLMLAGRGAQVEDLKTKLLESLEFTPEDNTLLSASFPLVPLIGDEMKSIVAEGALECMNFLNGKGEDFFKQEKIYARVGILTERTGGNEYDELISQKHQRKPVKKHDFPTNKTGYLLEHTISEMDDIRSITILQTFQDEEGIIAHLSDKDFFDTSSIIAEFDRSVINNGTGYIKILICEDGEIFIKLNGAGSSVSPTIDIKKSTAFKMSMWPIINYN